PFGFVINGLLIVRRSGRFPGSCYRHLSHEIDFSTGPRPRMLVMGFERDMKIEILRHQLNLSEIDCRGNRKKRGRRKNRVTGSGGSLRLSDLGAGNPSTA